MIANKKKETITANQIIWLTVALGPMGIISLPREINQFTQQSGWMMILVTFPLVLLFSRFIFVLATRYPDKTIISISSIILGKWLGRCVSLCLIFVLIFGSATSVRMESDIVVIYLLVHTPLPVIILTMLLSVMYVINTGIGTIARMNELMQPIIFLLFLLLLLMMLPKTDFTNFFPLISEESSWQKAVRPSLYPYILLFSIPFLSKFSGQPKQLWRGMSWGILIIFLKSLLLFVFTIAIFGPAETNYLQYPSMDLTRIIKFPVLERMEILFMLFWITIEFALLTIFCYLGSFALQKVFAKGSFFLWSLIFLSIVFVLSLIPVNIDETHRFSYYLQSISLAIFFLLFPFLVIIDSLKKRVNR